jgi:hypothetical protein
MSSMRVVSANHWFSKVAISTWLASAAIIMLLLQRLDQVIHGELYGYGLNFSPDWAIPYWSLSSFIYISTAITSTLGVAAIAVGVRDFIIHKNQIRSSRTKSIDNWFSDAVIILWLVFGATITLSLSRIDSIVNVELYSYGLQFSLNWAVPYWTALRFIYVFIAIPTTLCALELIFAAWSAISGRQLIDRPIYVKTQPSLRTEPVHLSGPEPRKVGQPGSPSQCPSCRREVKRALVMMDYDTKPPRLMAICPYCNARLGQINETNPAILESNTITKARGQ